jgi:hypothetical protein
VITRKLLAALPIALLAMVTPANADSFTYNGFSVNPGTGVDITLSPPVVATPFSESVKAGQITLNGSGPNAGMNIMAWCVDLLNPLQMSSTYNIVPLSVGGSPGNGNPSFGATVYQEIGDLMLFGQSGSDTQLDATQIAIWKLEYGSSIAFPTLSSLLDTEANSLISRVGLGGDLFNSNVTIMLLDAVPANQILAFAAPSEVPLPAAVWMFLGGLGLLGWFRSKWRFGF